MGLFQIRVATDLCVTIGIDCPDHIDLDTFIAGVSEGVYSQSTGDTIYVALRYDVDAHEVSTLQCPKDSLRTLLEHVPDEPVYICVDTTLAPMTVSLCASDDVPQGARFQTSVLLSMLS